MANSIPTLTGLATPITFLENTVNAAPGIIDADVTFTDADNNFNGGALTVTGLLAEDSVAIRNQGTGAGQIGISGGNVTFGGTVIGSFTGGAGSTFSVTFNASATAGGIEALIENLTYANSSNTPTASRSLELKVSDAAGFAAIAPITFAQQTGADNPFNGLTSSTGVHRVAFGDLDGDGDLDAVVGENDGGLFYYLENTGSAIAPAFTAHIGAANPFNGIDVGSQATPAFADLDGDGDLDVVVGESGGTLRFFENTGTAIALAFTERTGAANPFNGIDVGSQSAPAIADLDGDGDFDAVVGVSDGTLRFFENTGTAIAPAFTERTGAANPFNGIDVGSRSSPGFADLDGDGDLDVLVGTVAATLHYVENTGTAIAPAFTVRTGAANPFNDISAAQDSEISLQAATPTFGDLDGDGDLDAVQGANQNALRYFLNTTPHQPTQHFDQQTGVANPFNGIDVGSYSTPSFGDLDGDGDLDAVVGENNGALRYFKNTGTAIAPAFTEQTGAASPFSGIDVGIASTPSFADLDGDGDLDAVVGGIGGSLSYFKNTGSAVAPVFTQQTGAANPLNGINVGLGSNPGFVDLDADGDLDAVVGEGLGSLRYFKNTGTALAPTFAEQTGAANPFNGIDVGSYSSPSFSDLDNDGDLDAVVGENDGTVHYYENTGSAGAPAFIERTGAANPFNGVDVGTFSTPSFTDLDADGDLDAVVGNLDGTLRYFLNTGAGFTQVVNVTAQNDAPVISLDGDLDAVVANLFGNNVSVLLGNGAGGFTAATPVDVGSAPIPVALGDVDGDGDLDALVGNFNGSTVSVLLGNGAGGFTAATSVGVGYFPISVALGDVDGDGHLDALVANYTSNVSVLLGNGAGGFTATTVGAGTRPNSVALGDVNGDGRLDALVANASDNNVSVLLGDGAGGFTTATPVGVGTLPRSVALGDVDGDGDLDALVANANSHTVSVLLGNGAGGFTAATPVGVGLTPYSVALGDVDGDGDLDAVVANFNSHTVSVLLGDGAGGFTAATPVGVGTFPFSVALGDVNGDGHLDALVVNRGSNTISVLLGNGAGGFTAAAPVGAGNAPRSVALGDVNNAQITDEDTSFVFSAANGNALTLSDDAGNDETLTLAAQHGKLTLATLAGLAGVSGNGTHTVAFTGTVAEINAALNGLSYAPDQDFYGSDTLTVTVNDNASAAVGGPLTATKLVPITVTSVEDAPVITSGTTATAAENVSTATVVYDAAAQDPDGDSVTFSLSAGGDNDLFKIDATTGEVTFKTSPNYEAPGDAGGNNVYDVVVRASDGVLTTTKAVAITVMDVNAAPVIVSGGAVNVAENVSTATVVYDAAAADDGEDSGIVTFSLSAGGDNDLFKIDAATGEITFKASPNYEAPGDAGGNNVYDIVVRASDGLLSETKAVSITVTNVNEAPAITSGSTATVVENVSTATVVYDATAQDPEGDSVTFSLSSGGDNDLFDINDTTGEVTFKGSPNYEAPGDAGSNNIYDIVVRASDGVLDTTKAVSITVTDVNAAPVITSGSTATVAENVSTSAVVYQAAAADDGEDSGIVTFSLSPGRDNDLFDIDGTTGAITFKFSPNYEAPGDAGGDNVYDIVVRASDGVLATTKAVSITVTDVNATPVFTSGSTATVAENVSTAAVAYAAAVEDDGEDSGSLTFSLWTGGDNDLFDIDATTGEVTFKISPNYEATGDLGKNNVYDIIILATDGLLSATKDVSITVTDVNAAPVITSGSTATAAENVSTSTVVYDAAAQDDDEDSGSVTFSLSAGGDNDLFKIDATTGEVTFKVSPNYEAPGDAGGDNVYDIGVRASDGVLTTTKAVAITVTNVNAAPVIVSGSTATAAENLSTAAVVYDAVAQDDGEDSGSVTFSLSADGDNDLFDIDAATGEVTFKVSPNYEAPGDAGGNNVYDIVVHASDGLLSATKAVAITVTNVNVAPVIVSAAAVTAAENVSTSTVVYDAAAKDDGEDSGSVTFALSAGGDNDVFNIDAATGEVTFKTSPNYEAPGDADGDNVYDIVIHAIDGVLATTKVVSITVTNVNEAPVITSGSTATVAENVSTVAVVYGTSVIDDGESGSAVTFSLGGKVDDSRFDIDPATGAVTFKASPDYEAPSDAGADNVYDIVVQASDGLLTTLRPVRITVTNVNAAPVITSGSTATAAENVSTLAEVYKVAVTDDGESGSAVTFSLGGGADDNRFTIDPTTGVVTFKATPDYEAPWDAGADNVYDIVVRASDGLQTATRSVAITVTNVNAAPVIGSGATATVAENVSTATEVYKTSIQNNGESSGAITFSLDGGADDNRFIIDPTTGAVTFKASPDYEAPSDAGADNVYDIVVHASDGVQAATKSVSITVTNVNAAPAIVSGATATVAENVSTSTEIYKVLVADDGESGSAVTFSLVGGVDDNRFTIDPTTGAVTFKASPNYEAPSDAGADNVYDIIVQASDGLATTTRSVRITVTNVNAAPAITSGSTVTVVENVSTSTEVYKISVADDGESGSAVTFSLGGGIDDSRFTMDSTTGVVTFKASPDYEAPSDAGADNVYDIVVRASDGSSTTMRSVSITVTNVNAAPVITSGPTATVAENVSTATEIYKVSVANGGENGSAVTFSLGGGADDSRFTIDPTTGAVTFKASPDYEAPSDTGADNVYDIVVRASDGSSSTMRSVAITVTNVNAAPVIVSGATATVAENVSASTEVYKVSVTDDGESGSAVTFSLGGGVDDSRFTMDPTTGGVTFKASPDYEAPSDAGTDNVYDIVVQASDGLAPTMRSVQITVTNLNVAPVIVSGPTATVAENVSTSTEVYKVSVADDGESGSAVTFSLGGGADDNRFTIDPTTGAVSFKASPDYEAPSDAGADNVYDIVVLANDGLQTAARSVAITVTNVNAAPVIVSGSTATVAENVPTSTEVYKVSATDDGESGSAVTFSLGGGADDSRFTIGPTTGVVTFKASPNYEAPSDAGADNVYDIVVQASDGLSTAVRSVSISVSNVVEATNAVNDAYVLIEGGTLITGPTGNLLLNDDVSGLVSTALVAGPGHGTLQFATDGGFLYAPDAGFSGIDRFEYGIVDGSGIGHVAEALIYVTPVNVGVATTLDLLALTAEEQVAATYVAFLDRAADAAGFTFWVDQFNDGLPTQGPALLFANIASSIGISGEAKALYPFLASPFGAGAGLITDFVESVYDNLFNRSSDAGGLAYWTGQIQQTLASGRFVGSVLVDIISGAQDTAAGRDITTLMSKVAVSLAFVREQQEDNMQWLGSSDVAAAKQLLDAVSSDQASVLMGVKNADTLVELHP